MTLTPRTDLPTQPGWYIVLRRGVATPAVLWWSKHSPYWLEGARRVDVVAWDGPIVMPREEL